MTDNFIYLKLEGVIGEKTGEKYDGDFKLVKYLTNKELGEVSRYLEFLCEGIARDPNIILLYQGVAHLKKHVVEAPKWWTDSENGLNLRDTEPVFNLYEQLVKVQNPKKEEPKEPEAQEKPTV